MKQVNIQHVFAIPPQYPWIAFNQTGVLNGFINPPIRDFRTGEWQDSVTGDYGVFIPFDKWDTSVREVADLTDIVEKLLTTRRRPKCVKSSAR